MAKDEHASLPLWSRATDRLFRKALRQYRLVVNYEVDSMGGTRWDADVIGRIFRYGKELQADINELEVMEYCLENTGKLSKSKSQVKKIVRSAKEYCHDVIELINETEQKPAFETTIAGEVDDDDDDDGEDGDEDEGAQAEATAVPGGGKNMGDVVQMDGLAQQHDFVPLDGGNAEGLKKINPVDSAHARSPGGRERSRSSRSPVQGFKYRNRAKDTYKSEKLPRLNPKADTWRRATDGSP